MRASTHSVAMNGWLGVPYRVPLAVVVLVFAALLLLASSPGPDFSRYEAWTAAFVLEDVFLLGGPVGSPLGIPLTQWAHGPGLIWGFATMMLGGVVDRFAGAMIAGWLGALVFWWAMWRLLSWAARGAFPLVVFAAGAMFLGTHGGFYSLAHGSESTALALVGVVTLWIVEPRRSVAFDSLLVGSATALLLITRSYVVVYAIPSLVVLGLRIMAPGSTRRIRFRLLATVCLVGPLVVALGQLALVNRWMTGAMTKSAYVYGNGDFSSLDWLHPEFLAVLVHPWHGLLTYHPLYAVGFAALSILFLTATSRAEQLLYLSALAGVLVNLYVQAAWFAWWMGTGTFGLRGMAVCAVVLIPALTRAISNTARQSQVKVRCWLLLTVACCVWSYLLALQGTTQFFSYADLLDGQQRAITMLSERRILVSIGVALILTVGLLQSNRVRANEPKPDRWLEAAACVVGTLSLAYLFCQVSLWPLLPALTLALPALLMVIGIWGTRVMCGWGISLFRATADNEADMQSMVGWGIVATFLATSLIFANLAFLTERRLTMGALQTVTFSYTSDFYVPEALASYSEYLSIQGFDDKKRALLGFLQEHGLRR